MTAYNTIAWQTDTTDVTNTADSSPATGIEESILARIGSADQPIATRETTTAGTYEREFAPYELVGASIVLDWSSKTAGLTFDPVQSTITLTDPATLSASTQYCTVSQMYDHFGSENVNKWSDKNNFRIIDEIAQAIIDSIVNASSRIDSLMRDKYYEVPFSTVPYEIMHVCRLMAGVQLHAARGIEDDDDTVVMSAGKEAKMIIKQILAGQILFDLPTAQRAV